MLTLKEVLPQNGLILLAVAMETGFELGGTRGRRKTMPLTVRLITPEILAAPHHFSMASTYKSCEISLPELSFYEFSVCSNNTFTSIRRSSLKWWDAMTYKFGGVLCGVDKRAVSGIHFLRPPQAGGGIYSGYSGATSIQWTLCKRCIHWKEDVGIRWHQQLIGYVALALSTVLLYKPRAILY